jgi:acyl CoA:acetate/3-ketoacid CoA transferase alpha subunit
MAERMRAGGAGIPGFYTKTGVGTVIAEGKAVVNRIITNLGVLDVVEGGLKIVETADGVSEAELRAATLAKIVN